LRCISGFALPLLPSISHIPGLGRGNMRSPRIVDMNARTVPPGNMQAAAPPQRFDAQFIEQHKLIDRYLENKLPYKGARDLENWCRAHPEYLSGLKLSARAQASLKLLEASGPTLPSRNRLGGSTCTC
jgi:hypothetical protein